MLTQQRRYSKRRKDSRVEGIGFKFKITPDFNLYLLCRLRTILQKIIHLIKNKNFFLKESYFQRIIIMNSQILLNYHRRKPDFG